MAPGRDPDRAMFADELRAMRKAADLSRDELGARVGYSGATIDADYDAEMIQADAVTTVEVDTPDGQRVETTFDLSSLR